MTGRQPFNRKVSTMMKALAPGRSRGASRLGFSLVWAVVWPVFVLAQDEPGKTSSKTKAAAPSKAQAAEPSKAQPATDAAIDKEALKKAAIDPTKAKAAETTEVWKDPKAEAVLKEQFPELPPPRPPLTSLDVAAVKNMAAGQATLDRALVQRYLAFYAAELTRRANVQALTDPDGDSRRARAIEDATTRLIEPLTTAQSNNNTRFRMEYTRLLVPIVQQLLKNNLYARLEGMIVLSRSGDAAAVDLFANALKDPDQVLAVKERAAVGLILAAQEGRTDLSPDLAIKAAGALAEFLEKEPEAFWPAQARALEALGSLRQSSTNPGQAQAEFATTALRFLADPKARLDVRAWAGWALGWMRINTAAAKFNFSLVTYHIGQAAADIATRLAEVEETNPTQARHLTNGLLHLLEGLNGAPGVQGAGLKKMEHPNFGGSRKFVNDVETKVRELATLALDLVRAAGVQRAPKRQALLAKANELRQFLAKNEPADHALLPGGPQFPGPEAKVASGAKADAATKP